MQIIKNCNTCEFNFNQVCAGHGDLFNYGDNIKGIITDSKDCSGWGASLDYFKEMIEKAPWYIKNDFNNSKIKYVEFLDRLEKDYNSIGFEVNLYDAIEQIYKLKSWELAEILGVTTGVIGYARYKGTVSKRVTDFSYKLCIPTEFFECFLSTDLETLKECSRKFYSIKKKK